MKTKLKKLNYTKSTAVLLITLLGLPTLLLIPSKQVADEKYCRKRIAELSIYDPVDAADLPSYSECMKLDSNNKNPYDPSE